MGLSSTKTKLDELNARLENIGKKSKPVQSVQMIELKPMPAKRFSSNLAEIV